MLKLVKPSKKYIKSFMRVIDEYRHDKNHFARAMIDPMIAALDENQIDKHLKQISDMEKGINLKPGYVPGTTFWLMDDDKWIGAFNIRHYLNEKLEQSGGHIAANIAPKYRGTYSSFVGIKKCLAKAKKLGLDKVLMTCDVNNSASYRAIGGLLRLYGGEQISDSIGETFHQHRFWINTEIKK